MEKGHRFDYWPITDADQLIYACIWEWTGPQTHANYTLD
jgi:hypothetical protein